MVLQPQSWDLHPAAHTLHPAAPCVLHPPSCTHTHPHPAPHTPLPAPHSPRVLPGPGHGGLVGRSGRPVEPQGHLVARATKATPATLGRSSHPAPTVPQGTLPQPPRPHPGTSRRRQGGPAPGGLRSPKLGYHSPHLGSQVPGPWCCAGIVLGPKGDAATGARRGAPCPG